MLKEFKDFAMRGNVMDLAIAVIIGGAFGKIITSLVNDVLMPLIGLILGGLDFSELSLANCLSLLATRLSCMARSSNPLLISPLLPSSSSCLCEQ